MILLLTGAKKNVGDFLITQRARELLEHVLGEEVVTVPSWEPLTQRAEELERCRAIVIGGGPGIRPNLYPDIYPLLPDPAELRALGKPLVLLGSGSGLPTGDAYEARRVKFWDSTRALLDTMGELVRFSVRDPVTKTLLESNGVRDVVFTGCPAWYRLDKLNEGFHKPERVGSLVYTTPANIVNAEPSKAVLEALVERFEGATVYCAFHRGITADSQTSHAAAQFFGDLAAHASGLGCEVVDASYDTARIAFYDECDLHVGYRVHAHYYFLSARRPSVLIEEDGRGAGANHALNTPGIKAWELSGLAQAFRRVDLGRVSDAVIRRQPDRTVSSTATEKTMSVVDRHLAQGFAVFDRVAERIDSRYATMASFIRSI